MLRSESDGRCELPLQSMLLLCNSNIETSTQQRALASAVATATIATATLMLKSESDGRCELPLRSMNVNVITIKQS